jgi:hypothetical protein
MFVNDDVLQVLHVTLDNTDMPYLYVTDYTTHPDLPAAPSGEVWSRGLEGRIVKISLFDEQVEMAKTLQPGCFYSIRNLRLKKFTTFSEIQGRLGGNERLVHKLKVKDTANEELKALLR